MIRAFILSLWRIFALMEKEFIAMWMDRGTRKVLIAPILVQCLVFGYGIDNELHDIPYAVCDQSHSSQSDGLLFDLNNNGVFSLKKSCGDITCLREQVDSQEVLVGLCFDGEFARTGEMFIITDGRNTTSANTAAGYVSQVVAAYNAKMGISSPLTVVTRYQYNENNITRYTILVSMILVLSVIQVMLLASLTVSREREEGTFDMMLMTPTTPVEILIGKAVPPVTVAMLQGAALSLICVFYFDIPFRGQVLDLLLAILLFSCSVVGLALAISSVCKTSIQSLVTAFIFVMPCILTSGMLTPADAMPSWFRVITYVNPVYYGINIVWRIFLEGQSFWQVIHLFIPFVLLMAVTMTMAVKLFRSKLG